MSSNDFWTISQIYGDPEAADIVFTCGADILVVGINITTQVCLKGFGLFIFITCSGYTTLEFIRILILPMISDSDLLELRNSKGRYAQLLCDMCQFYRDWHVKSDGVYGKEALYSFFFAINICNLSRLTWTKFSNAGIFLHDPVCFAALVRPDLFSFKKGVVRVETQGICVGHTLMDQGLKKYGFSCLVWILFNLIWIRLTSEHQSIYMLQLEQQ